MRFAPHSGDTGAVALSDLPDGFRAALPKARKANLAHDSRAAARRHLLSEANRGLMMNGSDANSLCICGPVSTVGLKTGSFRNVEGRHN